MKLVVITPPEKIDNEYHIIKKLLKAGLNTLHIRKPDFSKNEMRDFIMSIPEKYHKKLVLHSHHSLSLEFKLKGIHFTERDRKNYLFHFLKYGFYSLMKPNLLFSASYHSINEVEKLRNIYKYVFLSPVFPSISKVDSKKGMDMSRIQDALRKTDAKVIALGGIEEDKLVRCQNVGFVGIAVLGTIWQAECPLNAFLNIQALCKKARHQSLALLD
jgi:thiamine-phosphate pyrophosphorylase